MIACLRAKVGDLQGLWFIGSVEKFSNEEERKNFKI